MTEPLNEHTLLRLAHMAQEPSVQNQGGLVTWQPHVGACACIGKKRPSDPVCSCAMWGLLSERRAEVAAYLDAHPDLPPEPDESRLSWKVVLGDLGETRLTVMVEVRKMFGLSLGEAKATVDGRRPILESRDRYDIEYAAFRLEKAGIPAEIVDVWN